MWFSFFKNWSGKRQKKFETIRYAFPLVVIASIFAGLASIVTVQDSYVILSSSVEEVARDQEFTISISVSAHVPVNAIDLVISYSEDNIEIRSIDTGTSVITLWTETPYADQGKIFLRGGTFRKGFVGEHEIAQIKVRAKEAGSARFFVSATELVAGDGLGSPVEVTESDEYNEMKIAITGDDTGLVTGKATISIITDTDGDGDVDLGDITAFMTAWLTRSDTFDFNHDGRMTIADFSILLADSFSR
jgi:hypothetical protein